MKIYELHINLHLKLHINGTAYKCIWRQRCTLVERKGASKLLIETKMLILNCSHSLFFQQILYEWLLYGTTVWQRKYKTPYVRETYILV